MLREETQMDRKWRVAVVLAMMGMTFGAVAFAAGTDPQGKKEEKSAAEAAKEGAEAAAKAGGGSNRGYVVGKGGVARLRDSGADTAAPGRTADIGVNEPGVNRKARAGGLGGREEAEPKTGKE
jgi:hypothetical protein